jgi:hypothetical protein
MQQQTQTVICPRPTRSREDDQIVEVFLHAYQGGRFAHKVEWLPQHETNVEVIASSEDGTRLAIEHTKLFEFPVGHQMNPDEDQMLQEVCAHLSGIQLPVSDRVFMLSVDPKNLKKLLTKRHRSKTLGQLAGWAQQALPSLHDEREFEVLIPTNLPRSERIVRIGVEVWKTRSNRAILPCCGYLPSRPDIVSLVRKAFEEKLPKLSGARADRRILMLEVVTLDSDSKVYETVRNLGREFPQFLAVDEFVFVRNFFELGAVFCISNTVMNEWSTVIVAPDEHRLAQIRGFGLIQW